MDKKTKDVTVVGFALFSMFLGAGNLIFPPTLGILSGDRWYMAALGFILTAVGLTVLGIIVSSKAWGKVESLGIKISKKVANLLGLIIVLAIGPLLAIPRTAATTYEIGIQTTMPFISPIVGAILFFAIVLYFVLQPSSLIDRLGKYLTPALIFIIAAIVIKGIVTPLGPIGKPSVDKVFLNGFEEGYQTMDAIGSVILASIVVNFIVSRGYTDHDEMYRMSRKTAFIAGSFLALVYGGLTFVGATASETISRDLTRTEILVEITDALYGDLGKYTLAIAITLACITTAVGLTSTAASYFEELTDGKIGYSSFAVLIAVFAGAFAVTGVDAIIQVAAPLLSIIYPVVIVILVLHVFDRYIPVRGVYTGAALGAFIVSFLQVLFRGERMINDAMESLFSMPIFSFIDYHRFSFDIPIKIIENLPLSAQGFAWIAPAAVLGFLFYFIDRRPNKAVEELS